MISNALPLSAIEQKEPAGEFPMETLHTGRRIKLGIIQNYFRIISEKFISENSKLENAKSFSFRLFPNSIVCKFGEFKFGTRNIRMDHPTDGF